MAQQVDLQHVRLPEARVYAGGQVHGFKPGEPLLLPAAHVEALRGAGHRVEAHDPNAAPAADATEAGASA